MRKTNFLFVFAVAVFVLLSLGSAIAQEKPDFSKVVGTWNIEVYAGDQTYSLNLVVTDENGQLAGKISESMGTFTDVAISDISYDSVAFRFDFVSPTPPDGLSRTVKADFKVGEDTMGGVINVPDLEITADAKATRETR
jgi:hypothetical protein